MRKEPSVGDLKVLSFADTLPEEFKPGNPSVAGEVWRKLSWDLNRQQLLWRIRDLRSKFAASRQESANLLRFGELLRDLAPSAMDARDMIAKVGA